MTQNPDEIDRRLQFSLELFSVPADSNYYLWTYASDGTLLETNCRDLVLERFFKRSGRFDAMMDYASGNTKPLLMTNVLKMAWGAVFETEEGKPGRIHVLGPVFTQMLTQTELVQQVWGKISPRWKPKYLKIMERIPVLSSMSFLHRVLMAQYCVTGERMQISDIVIQREKEEEAREKSPEPEDAQGGADRLQAYRTEQFLLRFIRNGDMHYQEAVQQADLFFAGNRRDSGDALRHARLEQAQFIALCCQAAMDGGLSAEAAYNRKDAYVQDVENAKTMFELAQIGRTMYVDYITLVHRQRRNPAYGKAVQSTCDYIESHWNQKLTAETLAGRVGYSGYYLSRLFKKETGFSLDEYARNVKIERAKRMLTSTQDSIQDIASALGFGGRNYFTAIFRRVTGMPPAAYRRKYQKL